MNDDFVPTPGELTADEKRQMALIASLPTNEAFLVWREVACYPVLKQLEMKLKNPGALSDIELRASIMHYNSVKYLFEEVFDQAKFITKEPE